MKTDNDTEAIKTEIAHGLLRLQAREKEVGLINEDLERLGELKTRLVFEVECAERLCQRNENVVDRVPLFRDNELLNRSVQLMRAVNELEAWKLTACSRVKSHLNVA